MPQKNTFHFFFFQKFRTRMKKWKNSPNLLSSRSSKNWIFEIFSFARVSKKWNELSNNKELWEKLALHLSVGQDVQISTVLTWKNFQKLYILPNIIFISIYPFSRGFKKSIDCKTFCKYKMISEIYKDETEWRYLSCGSLGDNIDFYELKLERKVQIKGKDFRFILSFLIKSDFEKTLKTIFDFLESWKYLSDSSLYLLNTVNLNNIELADNEANIILQHYQYYSKKLGVGTKIRKKFNKEFLFC